MNIVVTNPLELYQLLESQEGYYKSNQKVVEFMDRAFIYLNGCKCSEIENYDELEKSYKIIYSEIDFIISVLKIERFLNLEQLILK